MTQKEKKEILTKDLGGRLLYGVICKTSIGDYKLLGIDDDLIHLDAPVYEVGDDYFHFYEDIKPYLRPMSSMTEEEKAEYNLAADRDLDRMADKVGRKLQGDEKLDETLTPYYEHIDWLNAHHFDYRGLIEKGLALEAPDGMYN